MGIKFKNNAYGTISTGIASSASRTNIIINLTSGHGVRFYPLSVAGDYFIFDLINSANQIERFKATSIAADTITAIGAQEGTQALSFSPGDRIESRETAAWFEALEQQFHLRSFVTASGSVDVITGSIVSNSTVLENGMHVRVVALGTNQSSAPTFQLVFDASSYGGIATNSAVKAVVKGNNEPLTVGDIPAAGYQCEFSYNSTWDKWVMGNPYYGNFYSSMTIDYFGTAAPPGWIWPDGRTIGSAASVATNRAHADTFTLYSTLWTLGMTPVGGQGVSAVADFAANKPMPTPDYRGRGSKGYDAMGGTAAGRLSLGGPTSTGGTETKTLTVAEMPPHNHPVTQHTNVVNYAAGTGTGMMINAIATDTGTTGGGAVFSILDPTIVCYKIMKL